MVLEVLSALKKFFATYPSRFMDRAHKYAGYWKGYSSVFFFVNIALALVVGALFPPLAAALRPLLPYVVFFTLFPAMMGVPVEGLSERGKRALRRRKAVYGERYFVEGLSERGKRALLVSAVVNFLVSPLIAYFWSGLFPIGVDPRLVVGWVLVFAVPSSVVMVVWTELSGGDRGTALAIQVMSLMVAILAIPLWMTLPAGVYVPADPVAMAITALWVIGLPFVAGVGARALVLHTDYGEEALENRIGPVLSSVSGIGMYLVMFIAISGEAPAILGNLHLVWVLALSTAIVYPLLLFLTMLVSKVSRLSYRDALPTWYATTSRDCIVALAVAATALGGLAVLPALVVPIFQTLLIYLIWEISVRIRRHVDSILFEIFPVDEY